MPTSQESTTNPATTTQPIPFTQSGIAITQFGDPDVLSYRHDLPTPQLNDDEVLVKIAYAGVNPVDYKTRQGKGWGAGNIKENQFANNMPAILGFDMAGVVVESRCANFKVGDRVAALSFDGQCYAQYKAISGDLLAIVPDTVSLKTAGALPCVGTTAKQVVDFANIKAGEHVVMNAPAGGVGHLAVQILMQRILKEKVQLTLICSKQKYEKLKSLIDVDKLAGWIDYTQYDDNDDFPQIKADILLDLVGDDAGVRALSTLKKAARVVVLPSIWVDKLKKAGADKNLTVDGFVSSPNGADLGEVLSMINKGVLQLQIQSEYPLSQTIQAHRDIEKGDSFGKIVLKVED